MPSEAPESVSGEGNAPVAPTAAGPLVQVDIAVLNRGQLLVYGWVLGLSTDIAALHMLADNWGVNLGATAARLARPDVSAHFSWPLSAGSDHGFYALVDVPDGFVPQELHFLAIDHAGRQTEHHIAVSIGPDEPPPVFLSPHLVTLDKLLPSLPGAEAARLMDFTAAALPLAEWMPATEDLDPPARFVVDLCCVLSERLLIVAGWILDPFDEVRDLTVTLGASRFDLRQASVATARPDLASTFAQFRNLGSTADSGFLFAAVLASPAAPNGVATFAFARGGRKLMLTRPCVCEPRQALRELMTLLAASDPEAVIGIAGHVETFLSTSAADREVRALLDNQQVAAALRLPESLHCVQPRCALHIDHAFPVARAGILVGGWFAAAPAVEGALTLTCHNRDASFDLGAHWTRCARPDVSAHFTQLGIVPTTQDHGFICFVPLDPERRPCFIAATFADGRTMRMRVALPPSAESAMWTVRSILSSFNSRHADLYTLMDRQIGPAVSSAWSARHRMPHVPLVERHGEAASGPEVSLIVPLYGRYDFAEYQMALFADDGDFARVELLYVVDDPSLYAAFKSQSAELYGMYRIPFTVVYPGRNLGFAGANNCGAAIAAGRRLLLMNSDVMPKYPGWIDALQRAYTGTPNVGILGAKLIYESGSVQHAGMEFRRSPAWGNMWTNYHPFKGQSAVGLAGLHDVPAVTAACVLIETELYRSLGGLSEEYILGDFEDSDLCLRVRSVGRRICVTLDVELYHLERQSQNRIGDGVFRTNVSIYNCWRHQQYWAATIEQLQP